MKVVAALVGVVVVLTLMTGGQLKLGTSSQGPIFGLSFHGPQSA